MIEKIAAEVLMIIAIVGMVSVLGFWPSLFIILYACTVSYKISNDL